MEYEFTFAICAYGDSVYLENAIESAEKQTIPVQIILATSTPSPFLEDMAKKHGLPYFVNPKHTGIADDWNFALSQIRTPYGAILHQDDVYFPEYARKVMEQFHRHPDAGIIFTDYADLRDDGKIRRNLLYLQVKRILLWPFYLKHVHRSCFWKTMILRFGSSISCPAVSYNCTGEKMLFDGSYTVDLDWDMWLRKAKQKGAFVYVPECLMAHRIAAGQETSAAIADHRRYQEDLRIFTRLWGKTIAGLLMKLYAISYRSNRSVKK